MTQNKKHQPSDPLAYDPHETDPQLLNDYSEFKSYETRHFKYPKVRTFFRQHAKAEQLPSLPLLVFIPGLGGSVAQFQPLLSSLVDLAPCLAVDWPGGGRSDYEPVAWEAYTTAALSELVETIIEEYRNVKVEQPVVLISHSMGTSVSAWLANRTVDHPTSLNKFIVGLVGICPVSGPPSEALCSNIRTLSWIPDWIFNLYRLWDGRGGPASASVARFVGPDACEDLKNLQYRFNKQSRTPVFKRMLFGMVPTSTTSLGVRMGGLWPTKVWSELEIPLFLVGGEADHITKPKEIQQILDALEAAGAQVAPSSTGSSRRSGPQDITDISNADFEGNKDRADDPFEDPHDDAHDDPSTPLETPADIPVQTCKPIQVVESMILPAPANHTLLYNPRTVRVLAGLISDFLCKNVTGRLSLGWQLQYLSREGKWDVKNLNKWKSVNPVSHAIGPKERPIFRAMKTLRQVDDVHCPQVFVQNWGDQIKDVLDISKDQPVYDSRDLERAGIHYHKFPTVSKIPPQAHEVEAFIKKVDQLRELQVKRAAEEEWVSPEKCVIGVHCHYGFNRTGYFLVCYLVERCGYTVAEAIDAFAKGRPNGIRHSHFLDQLHVRYNVENPANSQ